MIDSSPVRALSLFGDVATLLANGLWTLPAALAGGGGGGGGEAGSDEAAPPRDFPAPATLAPASAAAFSAALAHDWPADVRVPSVVSVLIRTVRTRAQLRCRGRGR